ncbi:MAG: hypothetical protein ACJAXW_001549 [Candidatus Azotimanducaceae bacterium]|jgi:uncharacterized protein (DUF58 family)
MTSLRPDHNRIHFADKGGAYTDIAELIRLRHAAKEVAALPVDKSRNPLAGLLTSNFRGRGIDFAEVRRYEPGDDVRTIDWRVTARTQQPHTKLFQEERERPVLMLVDQSRSMFFGSRIRFKSVLAGEVAALLAWLSLSGGDRVGGIVFNQTKHRDVRPRRSKHAVLRLLHEIDSFNHELKRELMHDSQQEQKTSDQSYLANALLNVRRVARHGCTVVVISDFQNLNEDAEIHLRQISQHNDVVGICVSDPLEARLPDPDLYTITNGQDRLEINTASAKNRLEYESYFQSRLRHVQQQFIKIKSPLLELSTADEVVPSLAAAIGRLSGGRR